jgi:hypothetical protein
MQERLDRSVCCARRAALLSVLVCAGACGHSAVSSTPAPEHARLEQVRPTEASAAPDRAQHMQATFWMAVAARDALVAGNLAGAKRAAQALAEHDYAGTLPEDWKHWVKQMQQRADEVVLAADVDAAAQAVAGLGLACGDCHSHLQRGPKPADEAALAWKDPPEELQERMHRHETGVDQLWLGLVRPSEAAWRNGTVTLTRAPLAPVLREGEEASPEFAVKLEKVRELGKRARTATSYSERASVYGELLAGCANCHFVAGIKTN